MVTNESDDPPGETGHPVRDRLVSETAHLIEPESTNKEMSGRLEKWLLKH